MRRVVFLFLVSACHPAVREGAGPESTLDAYLDALAHNRIDRAWELLGSDYKKSHDRAAFERALAASDAQANAARLKKGARSLQLYAELALPDGEKLPLVKEDGEWRFAHDPLDFYPQGAPLEALRSFLRAVENHRYEVAINFVPERYRATLTVDKLRDRWEGEHRADLLSQVSAVRAHLADPLEISGDEARLTVGERKQARLVKEGGVWKIESLE